MKKKQLPNSFGIILVLLVMIVFFTVRSGAFLTKSNILNVLRQVSMVGIASVGMLTVFLSGGIDLSAGSQVTIVNIVCAYLMVHVNMNPVLACILCILMTTLIGALNGIIITRLGILPIITTLCMTNILKGFSYIISGGMPIFGFPSYFNYLGQGYLFGIPFPVYIMAICLIFGWFLLNKTYFGRYFFSVGGNESAAELSGINTTHVKIASYSLCGFFNGLAAVVWLSRVNSGQPVTGQGFEFDVITALVLGGVSVVGGEGDIIGALIGVMIMGVLNNGLVLLNISEYYQLVLKGLILMAAVGIDSIKHMRKHKKVLKSQ